MSRGICIAVLVICGVAGMVKAAPLRMQGYTLPAIIAFRYNVIWVYTSECILYSNIYCIVTLYGASMAQEEQ